MPLSILKFFKFKKSSLDLRRLAISHWPPLASHFCCFLLGVFAVNLSQKPEPVPLKIGGLYFALPNAIILPSAESVQLVDKSNPTHLCMHADIFFNLIDEGGQYLLEMNMGAENISKIPDLLAVLRRGSFSLVGAQNKTTPPCNPKPRIFYGLSRPMP